VKSIFLFCLVFIAAACIAGVGYLLFFRDDPGKGKLASPILRRVSVITVPGAATTRPYKAVGTVKEAPANLLVSDVGGRIIEVFVKEGQTLKKGAPVIQLDDTHARAAYQNLQMKLGFAQAQLQMAMMGNLSSTLPSEESEYSRQGSSFEQSDGTVKKSTMSESSSSQKIATAAPVSKQPEHTPNQQPEAGQSISSTLSPSKGDSAELAQAKQQYAQLLEEMNSLQKLMAAYTLVMPKPGKLKHLQVEADQMITPHTVVAEIASSLSPRISARVPFKIYENLKEGDPVTIQVPNTYTSFKVDGRIQKIEPITETETAFGWISVEPTQGHASMFKTDYPVEVVLKVAGNDGFVWIPPSTVLLRHGRSAVFVLHTENGKTWVEERPVVTGEVDDEAIEIKEGLKPGEKIVLGGVNLLHDKQEVAITGVESLAP
jgi:multidrug efflux pump subunit AcrA (membrane-fusion protein)